MDTLFHCQHFIKAILIESIKKSRMVGIIGREGMGKSSTIGHFIQDHTSVYYLRIGTSYTIVNLFNELIYQLTNAYPSSPETLFDKMKQVSYLLTANNEKKLIIIDDAGRLSPRGLSTWFELRDNTMHTTGIVFIGLDYFQNNLLKAQKKGVPGIAEFFRRIETWYTVPSLKKNEIVKYGVDKKLNSDQIQMLKNTNLETISELENLVNAIIEESELAEKEQRTAKDVSLPGKELTNKKKKIAIVDDEKEQEELEEARKKARIEALKKARETKKVKGESKKSIKNEAVLD